jgi:hypothetical protein
LTNQLGEAGDVTLAVSASALEIDSVTPAAGWTVARAEIVGRIAMVWLRNVTQEVRFTATDVAGAIAVELVFGAIENPPNAAMESSRTTFEVADAGFVTLEVLEGQLTIVGTEAKDGWRVTEQEQDETEIEVEFTWADRKLEFKARLVGGEIVTLLEEEPLEPYEVAHEEEDDEHENEYEGADDD